MRVPHLRKPTIKAALVLGFGLVLALWGYTGYDFTVRMAAVEDQASRINTRYLEAQERLADIRAQVLAASVHVRDALLDPDRRLTSRYERQLEESYVAIDAALRDYVPILDTEAERQQVERLRREIDDFRRMTRRVLAASAQGPPSDIRAILNQNLVPRREAAIRVSEEVAALNRAAFVQHRLDIAALHRLAERRTWQQLTVAILASLGIAIIFSLYAGRLESQLITEMQTNEQHARDLQHLSTRLMSAQEEERRNVARELHDEVGQALTAVQVELSVAERRLRSAGQSPTLLADAETIAHDALQTVRDISQLLHPALLDDLGLPAAVEWQAKTFEARHGIAVNVVQESMGPRLPRELELAAYRIVQEALTNIAKHARATTCTIVLRRSEHDFEILVEDDGRGFDPAEFAHDRRGLGLVGMRERAALLAGRVTLDSERGAGTRVHVRLPVTDGAYGKTAVAAR